METVLVREGALSRATFLISGCCIGAGMIGLPVMSAMAGFMPTLLAMVVCYFFATGTGLLILEATLWFDREVNLISLADFALGKIGKWVTWTLFLFLFYCLFVAYIEGGGQLFSSLISSVFPFYVGREAGIIACALMVGITVYSGTNRVTSISRLFMMGLILSFCLLVAIGLPHMQVDRLQYANWKAVYSTIPILLVCFGYQNLIPTLTNYLNRNVSLVRQAIFLGNLIPFVTYFVWNFVILGILPDQESLNFAEIANRSDMVTGLLENASESKSVVVFANTFTFFAILTPFMANTMAFVDFLRDGLAIPKADHRVLLFAIVLLPPTMVTIFFPHLFLKALGIAGGLADVLLFGVLPVLIVGVGRYIKHIKGPFSAPGGKSYLMIILGVSLVLLLLKG